MFQLVELLSVSFCFSLSNKNKYKNKCGGDLSSTTNTHSRSPTNTLHNIEWSNEQKDGTLTPRSSFFNDGLCNTTLNSLQFWVLNKHKFWSLKSNSIFPCDLLLMNNAPMHHTWNYEKWHVHNIFKIEARIKFVPYTYTYACGKHSNRTIMLTKLLWGVI